MTVRIHATRMMRPGEVALWSEGGLVWCGLVGAKIEGVVFDVVAMNVVDAERLKRIVKSADEEGVLDAIAEWWIAGDGVGD